MFLSVPRSASSSSKRNSARLDLLSTMMSSPSNTKKPSSSSSDSPRDSLSPLDENARIDVLDRGRSRSAVELSRVDESTKGQSFPLRLIVHLHRKAAANTSVKQKQAPAKNKRSKNFTSPSQNFKLTRLPRFLDQQKHACHALLSSPATTDHQISG